MFIGMLNDVQPINFNTDKENAIKGAEELGLTYLLICEGAEVSDKVLYKDSSGLWKEGRMSDMKCTCGCTRKHRRRKKR